MALTVFAGGFVASLTDWLFMGDWLYKRYDQHPEIWRHPHGQGEMKAIAWSAPLPFITCAVFTLLCARLNLHSYNATVKLAFAIWLVGPLPLLIVNGLFIKMHSAITATYQNGTTPFASVGSFTSCAAVVNRTCFLWRQAAIASPVAMCVLPVPVSQER